MTNYIASQPSLNATNGGATNSGGWFDGPFQNLPNNYKYIEKYYSGYAMSELDFGSDFLIVGGARYEEVSSLFDESTWKTSAMYKSKILPRFGLPRESLLAAYDSNKI